MSLLLFMIVIVVIATCYISHKIDHACPWCLGEKVLSKIKDFFKKENK